MYIYYILYIIYIIYKLFKGKKNEMFHFVKYSGIVFINYIFIFIEQDTYKIHYKKSFLKSLF